MSLIQLLTRIKAPVEICFDLARSIDLHILSTKKTSEKAIAGRTTGLIGMNETVTWQARHFGITQRLTTRITQFYRPEHFVDELVAGAFKDIFHIHQFETKGDETIMTDRFYYEVPLKFLGTIFDVLLLRRHMYRLLKERNRFIKSVAESDAWKQFVPYSNV